MPLRLSLLRFTFTFTLTLTFTAGFASPAPGAAKPGVWTYPVPSEEFRSPDCDIPMLVGFLQVRGRVRNLVFEDVILHGKVNGKNFIRTEGAGSVAGLRLKNVRIGSALVTTRAGLEWSTTGNVAPVEISP